MNKKRYYRLGKYYCLINSKDFDKILESLRFNRLMVENYKITIKDIEKNLKETKVELNKIKDELNKLKYGDTPIKKISASDVEEIQHGNGITMYCQIIDGKKYRISKDTYDAIINPEQ